MAADGRGKVLGTSSKSPGVREKVQWTFSKHDKGLSVLEQYDLVSEDTYRGRGTLLCETEQGLKMIKPYTGSAKRLEKINQILKHLQEKGHEHLDLILKNKEESLISTDKDGFSYLVKNWWDVRECDVRSETDLLRCMQKLAYMHKDMFIQVENSCEVENLTLEYEKHNQQMKKIRGYIRRRKQKSAFEYLYLESVGRYLEYGEKASANLKEIGYEELKKQDVEMGSICHGMCNQHNFLMCEEQVALVNFDHFFLGNHMADVAQFMRKIMEKHNWNPYLAHRMLEAYDQILRIDQKQWKQLGVRMSYPEKYWKVSNFYYNNNKAFLPEKNVDKLNVILKQEEKWMDFMEAIFGASQF